MNKYKVKWLLGNRKTGHFFLDVNILANTYNKNNTNGVFSKG